ncbi:MAG: oligosaccharide flippase family protein [Clostridium sp.]|nr:oligosaccharide flippase family protein [Clostridium sp.]MDU7084336.1 oligosaccharide flippase family protein [Clostridium sp.]
MKIIKSNQLKIGIALSYISIMIKSVIELLYTPIMLRFLGQSEYGLYQLAYSTVSYLSLLSLGFGSAYIRYYSKYQSKNEKENIDKLNGLFMIVFIFIGIMSLIVGSVLVVNVDLLFGKSLSIAELNKSRILMAFLVINIALTFPSSVFQAYITAKEQFFFQRLINILTIILNPFLCLPLMLMGFKSIALVVISTILTITSLIINMWFCKYKIDMKFNYRNLNYKLLKEIGYFSFFIFINQIIDQINWNLDKFVLGAYSGTAGVAVYSLGATINNMYLQFSTSISNVFIPRVNKIVYSRNGDRELTKLFTKIGRIQFLVLMLILTGYIFVGKQFMLIWGGNSYGDSYYVTLCLIIPVTIPLIQNLGIEIQRAKNMHQFRSYAYLLIAIVNILISIPLCKLYGPVGAAIGTGISLILGNGLLMNWYYHYKLGINIRYFISEIIPLFKGLFLPIIFGSATMIFVNLSSIGGIILWVFMYIIIYCVSIWRFAMNKYEKNLVINIVKKLKGKSI